MIDCSTVLVKLEYQQPQTWRTLCVTDVMGAVACMARPQHKTKSRHRPSSSVWTPVTAGVAAVGAGQSLNRAIHRCGCRHAGLEA